MSTAYLSNTDADTLAATEPALAGWSAATSGDKTKALLQASSDIDNAMPYQGRIYDPSQTTRFPRIAYDAASSRGDPQSADRNLAVVWDWDSDTQAAVVPADVLLAVLYQADSILAGSREPRLAAEHDGVVYQITGALAESYKASPGNGVRTGLCRRAWMLMRKYRLRSGVLL